MSNDAMLLPLDEAALRGALAAWREAAPRMGLLALLPEAEKGKLPLLQGICRELGVPLAGAIFPALVTREGFVTAGVWLLRLDEMCPALMFGDLGGEEAAEKMAAAIEAALDEGGPAASRPTLFMLFDAMVPNIGSLLDGLYLRLADRVAYAGVNAGSETFQPMPCLFDGECVIGGGVLCLLLRHVSKVAIEHGYPVPERVMTATSTSGNRVSGIDWRPAFDVYQELIKSEYGIELTRENFYQHAVHFPFGILRASEEVVVRIPVALTDDGSLYCVGEVPANAVLVLLRAPAAGNECVARLATDLGVEEGAMRGGRLLSFYCAGRRMHLGEAAATELGALADKTGVATLAGALSLGEVGSTREWGYPLFHNATLVCLAWNEA